MSIDPIHPGIVTALVGAACGSALPTPAPTGDRAALGAGDGVEGTNFKEAQ